MLGVVERIGLAHPRRGFFNRGAVGHGKIDQLSQTRGLERIPPSPIERLGRLKTLGVSMQTIGARRLDHH